MVSHSTKQQYDLVWKLESVSNLLNGFNSSPLPPIKGSLKGKVLPKCGRKNALSDLVTFFFFLSLSPFIVFALLVCFAFLLLSQSSLCFALFNMFLFVCFQFLLYFVFHKNKKKMKNTKKYKKHCVFCVHWYSCTLDGH